MATHRRLQRLTRRRREDNGFTLIELLVAMGIFAVLLAVMMSVIVSMNSAMVKTKGIGDAAQNGLRASQTLDKQLRYADSVNTVGHGTTNTTDWYISFEAETGLSGTSALKCYQWRVHTGGLLQQRSWVSSPTNTSAVSTTSPAWQTVAAGVVNITSGVTPFTVQAQTAAGFTPVLLDLVLQGSGRPVGKAETKLTITARNSNTFSGSTVCNAARP
jgi:prepilin-type N-terminal cleavage/methylation domain-containing protein